MLSAPTVVTLVVMVVEHIFSLVMVGMQLVDRPIKVVLVENLQ